MVIAEYLQGIKLGLIFINFKVYAKISFQLLSSNKKIMRTFAIGLLDFSSICHSQTCSFMALGEAAYAVLSMAESHDDKAVQSGHWVGKVMQTECKIAKLA